MLQGFFFTSYTDFKERKDFNENMYVFVKSFIFNVT